MTANPCHVHVSSFDLSKAITFARFFSKIKLSPTARLVLRCLIDFYNPKKGLVYPGQDIISDCTGASLRSVVSAIEELRSEGLILTTKNKNHLNYHFTKKFFELAGIAHATGNFCTNKGENSAHSCHEQIKQNKNNNKNKILNFNKTVQEPKHISVESTKEILRQQAEIKKGSPLDYSYEEAVKFLNSLLPELRNSYFAKELRKKWNL